MIVWGVVLEEAFEGQSLPIEVLSVASNQLGHVFVQPQSLRQRQCFDGSLDLLYRAHVLADWTISLSILSYYLGRSAGSQLVLVFCATRSDGLAGGLLQDLDAAASADAGRAGLHHASQVGQGADATRCFHSELLLAHDPAH